MIGSLIVIVGVVVGLIPNFIQLRAHGFASSFFQGRNAWFWYSYNVSDCCRMIVMIINAFPGAWSFMLQQVLLADPFKDRIFRMVFWTNFYSTFGYILGIPLSSIPFFGGVIYFQL